MDAVARSNLRIVLPVLFLVAEVIHEGSEMNEETGIGGGRQRRAWIILLRSYAAAGTASVATCTKEHRQTGEAQRGSLEEVAANRSKHGADASQDPWSGPPGQLTVHRPRLLSDAKGCARNSKFHEIRLTRGMHAFLPNCARISA